METVTGGKFPWILQRMARSGSAVPDDDIILIKGKHKALSDEELSSVSGGYVGDQTDENRVDG